MASVEQAPLRVLVVDDDEIMREVLVMLLDAEGHTVTAVESAAQASERLTMGAMPDVILTDLHLPGTNAGEMLASLRKAKSPQTVLLGMSGSDPATGLRDKLDGFLLKPFSTEDFYEALSHVAHSAEPAGAAPTTKTQPKNEVPVLDMATYNRFASSMPASALPALYGMTLDDVAKRAEVARLAFAAGDESQWREEGHAIKGGCGMVGAMELRALGAAIEAGAPVDTSMLNEIAAASSRLRRMLDTLS